MEIIKLSDILELCIEFKNNPTEKNDKKIRDLLSNLQIRQYLPLIDKELVVITILSSLNESMDAIEAEMNYVSAKILFGVLAYIINFEMDVRFDLVPLSVIDALVELDIIDYILKFCEKDYKRLEKMVDEAINFSNMDRICKVPALLSDKKLEEFVQALKDFKQDLSPEMINAIKAISTETAPEWQTTKNLFGELFLKESVQNDLKELEREDKQEVAEETREV